MSFKEFCGNMEEIIKQSYESGVTQFKAEELAGTFLTAQLKVSDELKKADLDARMRKSGLKAVRASAYLEILSKNDKKPTEAQIGSIIDTNELVSREQDGFDKAEVERDHLKRYYDIFVNAHVHYRGISKGRFGE
jgi:hypothetical protein